jgi:DNA polymerase
MMVNHNTAIHHLSIDIETFSSVDIQKSGLYKYVQSPDFEILLFAYSLDGGPVQIVDLAQGENIPFNIQVALYDPDVIKHAYNAAFEWYCLSKYGSFANLAEWLPQWRCTMVHGLYCGYPGGLAKIGEAMGLPQDKKKMGIGSALIKTFCTPCRPTAKNGYRTQTLPHHEPEKWQLFKQYCMGDVITEMEVEKRLSAFPVPESEEYLWQLDQIINARGVAIDQELIDSALYIDEVVTAELMQEAVKISGLDNPKSVKQLTEWLQNETGEEIDNLQKGTVKDLIKTVDSDKARRMLEIRQELSKTSIKKYAAMKEAVCDDGRVRGLLQFYGANRTGRWAGRLVQTQNLPANHLPVIEWAREQTKARNIDALKLIYGNIPDTLSQLIRTAFIPSPGNTLAVADFSAIEARIIAWLADERWRLEVFATHGKIYEASAAAMFGVPVESITKGDPLRQKGKIAELALGYQGSVGALVTMGALKMGLTEEELPEIVQRWRQANKRIVDLWYTVENAVLEVIKTGQPVGINKGIIIAREGDYKNDLDFMTIQLPSGRKLYYVKPFLQANDRGREALSYWGLNQTSKKWEVIPTYGGKLVENIVQAIARDCLAESIKRLSNLGIVMHVHDEIVLDVPEGTGLEAICDIMGQPISWASDLLLRADGFLTPFYMKEG